MAEPVRVGTDTSGRPILMSEVMVDWWDGFRDRLGFNPLIIQGAYMASAGGGANASAGYHDRSGCLDLRTWDRTRGEVSTMIHAARQGGAGAWLRDRIHGGFDPHIHLVLGGDLADATDGARRQWAAYVAGRDGLAGGGPDYHPRPDPLVTQIPEDWTMPTASEIADAVWAKAVKKADGTGDTLAAGRLLARAELFCFRAATELRDLLIDRLAALDVVLAGIDAEQDAAATREQVKRVRADLRKLTEQITLINNHL